MQGGTFGAAVDAKDNAWLSSYGGQCITVFDKTGEPLTPPEGITFNGQLGLMQGIIVAPNGDVWAVGVSKNQLLIPTATASRRSATRRRSLNRYRERRADHVRGRPSPDLAFYTLLDRNPSSPTRCSHQLCPRGR